MANVYLDDNAACFEQVFDRRSKDGTHSINIVYA